MKEQEQDQKMKKISKSLQAEYQKHLKEKKSHSIKVINNFPSKRMMDGQKESNISFLKTYNPPKQPSKKASKNKCPLMKKSINQMKQIKKTGSFK
jgi:hypothetical protein